MNKTAIRNFAIWARNRLIADIKYRAGLMGITENGIASAMPQSTANSEFYDIGTANPYAISGDEINQRKALVTAIQKKERDSDYEIAYKYIIEEVAYTWFNRLIAVRFMEVNDYLTSHVRVLSSESGKTEPDLVTNPFEAGLDFSNTEEEMIIALKRDNKLDEVFKILFIKQCNTLNAVLPLLFEKTSDYTELLLNLSVIDQDGVIYHLVHDIPEEDFNVNEGGQVEIIGWMYQYYISEKHDEVVDILSGKGIKTEDVPAATQLFTTDWVVRYMVDNSLGRYWIERNPSSNLAEKLEFFVTSKEGTISYVDEKIEPHELTIFDPCMGSGHILVYAFDVLMEIYKECGYSERDAASLVVENNIFGVDIDKRAAQLAYFAVMMKARQYDRRFLSRGASPHLYCPDDDDAEAETLGSLLIVNELGEKPAEPEELTLFNIDYEHKIHMWEFRSLLSKKYSAVCTNPPYLNKYNNVLKKYILDNYKDYSGDMFSVFIYRKFEFCVENGYSAFMTPYVWMFIKTYEKLREYIIRNKSFTSLIQMEYSAFEEATVPICSFVLKNGNETQKGGCFRLSAFKGGMEVQKNKVLEAISNKNCGYFYESQQDNFSKIPGSPVAYWVSEPTIKAFSKGTLGDVADTKQGFATGDNNRFLRLWHEINAHKMGLGFRSRNEAQSSQMKWFPCNKGGSFRRWYGNNYYLANWESDGMEMRNFSGSVIRNPQYYFRQGITWSSLSSGGLSMRYSPVGFIFESKGSMCYLKDDYNLLYILALMNTKVVDSMLLILAPTLDYHEGPMAKVPVVFDDEKKEHISNIAEMCISLARQDWDSFELSWDFQKHPLIPVNNIENEFNPLPLAASGRENINNLQFYYDMWAHRCEVRFNQLKENEEELNHIFIEIYGLQEELTPEVGDKDITVRKADLQRDIKSLISYAVGCMFGRYSLNKDGLAYAGGEWDNSIYSTFLPDNDNVIPITDEEYLEDDIVARFCEWLKVVYGEKSVESNLDFIAKALGCRGDTSREVIRTYFLNDFFNDHCNIYSVTGSGKRPIYWLFDSGKQNGFKALVYMHRYNADTIGKVRVEYLHRMQRIYESEIGRMQDMIDNSKNNREVALATKRKEKLQKQLKECLEYDEKIGHLALARTEIELDDGVKVNYRKVQTASDGKFYEILADSKNIMSKEK